MRYTRCLLVVYAYLLTCFCACQPATPPAGEGGFPRTIAGAPTPFLDARLPSVDLAELPAVSAEYQEHALTETVALDSVLIPDLQTPGVEPQDPSVVSPCPPLQNHPLTELPEIVSSPYQPPPPGKEERHHGVDLAYYRRYGRDSIRGAVVQAVFQGRVASAIADRFPYGNMLIVETNSDGLPDEVRLALQLAADESLYTLYAHLESAPDLALGEQISACQQLGVVGQSGNAGVPHLHLEMRRGPSGVQFPSMAYYTSAATDVERHVYERWRTSGEFKHLDPMGVLAAGS